MIEEILSENNLGDYFTREDIVDAGLSVLKHYTCVTLYKKGNDVFSFRNMAFNQLKFKYELIDVTRDFLSGDVDDCCGRVVRGGVEK